MAEANGGTVNFRDGASSLSVRDYSMPVRVIARCIVAWKMIPGYSCILEKKNENSRLRSTLVVLLLSSFISSSGRNNRKGVDAGRNN